LVPLGSRMKGSDGDVLSGSYRMRRILMVLSVLVSSYPLARKTKTIRGLPFHGNTMFWNFEETYISTCVDPPLCGNGILSGVDQAIKPKMKIKTKPALHASANIGLRAPVDGSIILGSCVRFPLQIAKERQEEAAAMAGCARGRQTSGRPNGLGGSARFKGTRQPSAQRPSVQEQHVRVGARLRLAEAISGVDAPLRTQC
jgi:hypothetical protein